MYFILFTSRNKSFVSSCKQYRTFICWNMLFCCGCTPCTLCKPRSTGALHQLHAGPKPQTPLLPLGTKLREHHYPARQLRFYCSDEQCRCCRYEGGSDSIGTRCIWYDFPWKKFSGWFLAGIPLWFSPLNSMPNLSLLAVWALQFSLNLCWTLYNNTNRCNSMVFKVCFTTLTVCWSFTL